MTDSKKENMIYRNGKKNSKIDKRDTIFMGTWDVRKLFETSKFDQVEI